jgi:hypothetical protein
VSDYLALLQGTGGASREVEVRVTRDAGGTYEVRLGGKVHRVDAFRHDHGTLSLIVDTQSFTAMLDRRDGPSRVRVRDAVFTIDVLDERRRRLRRASQQPTT